MDLKILDEDNHIIVVYKPSGVLSQEDHSKNMDMLTLVKEYIKEKYQKKGEAYLGLVQRLDRNTEGLMVFARTSKAASRLCDQIKNHETFAKKYLAVVEGKMQIGEKKEVIDYLEKNEKENKSYISKNGKEAKLFYEVLDCKLVANEWLSLVNITLETGRHHQIRAQFSNLGHPLYGDLKYGARRIGGKYYALSSYSLEFSHPTLKEKRGYSYFIPSHIFLNFYKQDDFLKHYHL